MLDIMENLNKYKQGPYLSRSDTLWVKMLNINRSVAMQIKLHKLPKIESFLSNFNQLVL